MSPQVTQSQTSTNSLNANSRRDTNPKVVASITLLNKAPDVAGGVSLVDGVEDLALGGSGGRNGEEVSLVRACAHLISWLVLSALLPAPTHVSYF